MATQPELLGFHEFSFQSQPRTSPASFSRTMPTNVSPYSYPHNNQYVSVQDLSLLAHQFSQHSVQSDSHVANDYASSQRQVIRNSTSPPPGPYDCSHTSPSSIRSQRQANTRLQCQPSHAGEISSLVERVSASGEQCHVCTASSQRPSAPPAWHEDDGFEDEGLGDDDEDMANMSTRSLSYRRSTDLSNVSGYVSKSIRLRKKRRQRNDQARSQ